MQRLKDAAVGLLSDAVARTEQTQRVERSLRSRSAILRNPAVFALISYTPKDVPSWVWFSHISPANRPAQNFIGPVGAIIARICYQFIGAAACALAAILLGFGAAKLFYPALRFAPQLAWIVLFVISGACLLACAAVSFAGVARRLQHPGAGRLDRIRFRRSAPWITPATLLAHSVRFSC